MTLWRFLVGSLLNHGWVKTPSLLGPIPNGGRLKTLRLVAAIVLAVAVGGASAYAQGDQDDRKLDGELRRRADQEPSGRTQVIAELRPGWDATSDIKNLGGRLGRRLRTYNGQVLELNNGQLKKLAKSPAVLSIHYDRPIAAHNYITGLTIGSTAVRLDQGYTGAGIGVAVIDSGISSWHDDLTGAVSPYGDQRVTKFVDFVHGRTMPYDDYGHGTHVAGIIAGNGHDSLGLRTGAAPGAQIIALKVLDGSGLGTISNIIASLDYIVAHKTEFNIRVANLSVGARVSESYETDPLTLATKRAVQAGVVVVAAAGNFGKASNGGPLYGAITAPGNAPWVLTVGASDSLGTPKRGDDKIASFSSRGPTAVDYGAKPDLVAPGTNIVSLSDPTSFFYGAKPASLVNGLLATSYMPYLTLSGTSMAAPAVAGSVALMLQANPSLTPNAVKAILQYTAQVDGHYDFLTQGAGFLNTKAAVKLARFFKNAKPGDIYPSSSSWSHHIIWGNIRLAGGYLTPTATAWSNNIVWGSHVDGDNIVWGSVCPTADCDNIVWGSSLDNIVWGSNVVWGSSLDNIVWGSSLDNIVWGSNIVWASNIVWGSNCGGADCDNIVWGSNLDNIVWGSSLDNIVWGSGLDNIVWGSDFIGHDNIVWGSSLDNIVWGSSLDNIVWGSNLGDNIVWGSSADIETTNSDGADLLAEPVLDGSATVGGGL